VALSRVWVGSPNHSSSRSRNQILCIHTSEGATTFRNLGSFLAQPSAGVSYQVGFDDTSSTEIGEYVRPECKAWAALEANDWGEHACCCTPSGASSGWSRDVWLNQHPNMLAAAAAWLKEESDRFGIPLVKISGGDINAGRKGVCGHADITAAGYGNHTDPGQFPFDVVLAYALGTGPPATPGGSEEVLISGRWYPMAIFQSDDDARQAAALSWWADYLSRTPDAANLNRWATTIKDNGYASALLSFLNETEVKDRMAKRPW
jgi:hypothetical protein